jgi:hypothetical protein
MKDKELSDKEKMLNEVLFEGKENEYSSKIQTFQNILSKKIIPEREFPDFQELISSTSNHQNLIELRKNNMSAKIKIFLAAAAVLILGVFVGLNQFGSKSENQIEQGIVKAKIKFLSGEVSIKTVEGEEKPKPQIGTLLELSDIVLTGNRSVVEVEFSNGSVIRVKSNSEFAIKQIAVSSNGTQEEVFLQRGMLAADVKKRKQSDTFNVSTPTVIAGVRGTRFQVEVNPLKGATESTKVTVSEGSVGITKRTEAGLPATSEPIEILEASETAIEKGFGGDISKMSLSSEKLEEELSSTNDVSTEKDLIRALGRTEIEKITLSDKSIIRGVIINMDSAFFTVQTLDGIIKIEKEKVDSSESVKLK